jgi:hypothetical protein
MLQRSASPGSPAKGGVVNRTPLHNKAPALEPRDDSVTVNPASLAVLLGESAGRLRQ